MTQCAGSTIIHEQSFVLFSWIIIICYSIHQNSFPFFSKYRYSLISFARILSTHLLIINTIITNTHRKGSDH